MSRRRQSAFEGGFQDEVGRGCAGCVGFLIWVLVIGVGILIAKLAG
jgi:hypothetical protein